MDNQLDTRVAQSQDDMRALQQVRWDVFVLEQNVPPVLEIDARDFSPDTVHIVAQQGGDIIGTGRIIRDSPNNFHIGRLAVTRNARGTGVGRELMLALQREIQTLGQGEIHIFLDAQVAAQGFYESLGYVPTERDRFYDAGIEHLEMVRRLGTDT